MSDFSIGNEAERWHHHPGEVRLNPLFAWPLDLRAVWRWYRGAWLQFTALTVCVAIAVLVWALFLPPLDRMATLRPGWVLQLWALNVIPQTLVAGFLHWLLYTRRAQGMKRKFDRRDLAYENGTFSFGSQLWDNVYWTLVSAMTVATVYQVALFWAMANGWAPVVSFAEAPVWSVLWLALIPMWSGLHFYWVHRLAHSPRLYKHVHAVHRRNVNIGPWSGISNHWFENMLYFSTYWIHFLLPSGPLHVMVHVYFQQISPVFSHSGFEKIMARESDVARAGDFFHQLHHRYFECNYGTSEIPFDKWFGTYHDGSEAATARTRAHKTQMYTR